MSTLLALAIVLGDATAAESAIDPVAEAIRSRLEIAGQPAALQIGEEVVHASVVLPGFYERRGFAPLWSSEGRPSDRAEQLLQAIAEVPQHGLRPEDYHYAALEPRLRSAATEAGFVAETDLLLTDAFLILAAHLVSGRVDPATFEPEWIAVRREVDLAERLQAVVDGTNPRTVLRALRPQHEGYERLVGALARYRLIEAQGGWPRLGPGPALKPGMADPAVAILRERLSRTSDHGGVSVAAPETYDDELRDAVMRFQRRHGLDDDGIVGTRTREALDMSVARRIRAIELNLERWRWLPQNLGERYLLVNVPEFRLRVIESENEALTMRVIVGRAVRKTPVFSDLMRYLVFSPSWEVPPTILRQDKLPEIRKNPSFVVEQNMRVFLRGGGGWTEVEPATVDWSEVKPGTVRLRQRPGPTNALGLVKFMFPNPFHVYLHDTPSRELFSRSQRDFSSGCIRIEKPAELAVYVLRESPEWDAESIAAAMSSGRERSVTLPRPLPVHIQYWTAWAGPNGTVEFRRDLYSRDPRLDAALRLPPPDDPSEERNESP